MDPLSQGALGAAAAGSAAPRARITAAAVLGTLSGMAPDLDVLIRSSSDPLLFLEYHRQFTHALVFAPVGALLCAAVAYPLARRWLTFPVTYALCLLGFASHGVLDACTSYGTQLLWPFSDARVAWNRVSVIDPLLTLPLVGLVAAGLATGRRLPVRLALVWVLGYLALGALQGWRAERAALALAEARDHRPERLLVKPSFGNLLLWKVVYSAGGHFQVDAVRLGRAATYFPGARVRRLAVEHDLPWLEPGSRQHRDLQRFRWFSDGYLAEIPAGSGRVVDVRYSLVPNRLEPLWGIRLDATVPADAHAGYFTARETSAADRRALTAMVLRPGRPLPPQQEPTKARP